MTELRTLLETATDRIERPHLVGAALATAHRRQTRGRVAVATFAVAAVATAVALVPHHSDDVRPMPQTPTMTPTPTPSPGPDDTAAKAARWDPRDVDDLPAAGDDIAASLPRLVDPPATAPALDGAPLEAARLSVEVGGVAMLLGTDGSWRSVPLPRHEHAELSPGGTRLVVTTGQEAEVWTLAAGEVRVLPLPEGHQPFDYQSWSWLNDTDLLVVDAVGGFVVDAVTGAAERVPYPASTSFYWTVDPAGDVVETSGFGEPARLVDWHDGEGRTRSLRAHGHLAGPVAGRETIAGTTYDVGPAGFRVVALERSDLSLRDELLLDDFEGNYSNGALGSVALLGEDVVLLRVTKIGRTGYEGWRFVAWQVGTDELALVTRIDGADIGNVTLATGLLG